MKLQTILQALQQIAPLEFAESWDNVGLLVGNRGRDVTAVMTCLSFSTSTLEEAISERIGLVVCHHPIPFKPLAKITDDSTTGKILLRAIEEGLAIYSPHTAWDNAKNGINQQLAGLLGLDSVKPLQTYPSTVSTDETVGVGRFGSLPQATSIEDLMRRLQVAIPELRARHTHSKDHPVSRIGIVCGSGGSMLPVVARRGCNAMLTGEATYHQCLEAESLGVAMLLMGHHASEFFAMKSMAEQLLAQLPTLSVSSSQTESSGF